MTKDFAEDNLQLIINNNIYGIYIRYIRYIRFFNELHSMFGQPG